MTNQSHALLIFKGIECQFLVRLEFELKLEPLLLYSPPATAAATPTPPLF